MQTLSASMELPGQEDSDQCISFVCDMSPVSDRGETSRRINHGCGRTKLISFLEANFESPRFAPISFFASNPIGD